MKLKTLVSTLAVAGLVTTGAFAAPMAKDSQAGVMHSKFWQTVAVHPNQDNANGVVMLDKGVKITGLGSVALTQNDSDYFGATKGMSLALDQGELYFDAAMGNMATFHASSTILNNNALHVPGQAETNMLNFSEFNATLYHGNAWLTVGKQYGSFGSLAHDSITTPLTSQVAQLHGEGLTLGYALTNTGVFGNVSVYNGQQKITDDKNQVRGYSATLGYAMNQGMNKIFDFNGLQLRASMASDARDVFQFNQNTVPYQNKDVPAYSLFAQYVFNNFKFSATYLTSGNVEARTGMFPAQVKAAPSAYDIQAEYGFMTNNARVNTVILGYQGTNEDVFTIGNVPKSRMLVAYKYGLTKNLTLEAQYNVDKAHKDEFDGTSAQDDQIHARLQFTF